MAVKVFLDANVILDFTLKRPGYESAKDVIELITSGQVGGYITPSIVQISGYWLTKAYGHAMAKEILLLLLRDITVIDIPNEIVRMALHSKINDIEDALQYFTAIHYRLGYFISMDKDLKKESMPELPILTVSEFLDEIG